MVPALTQNFPVDLEMSPCENSSSGGQVSHHSWSFGAAATPASEKRRSAMKDQSQSPLRARLREFARSFREKSSLTRLKAKKPTLNPAPMARIKDG